MKSIITTALAISLLACGDGPTLASGTYTVHHTVAFSTDPFTAIGDEFDADWEIEEEDGRYTLTLGGDTKLKGREVKDQVVFSFYKVTGEECKFYTHLYAQIESQGNGFIGTASQFYDFCSSYDPEQGITGAQDWATEYNVEGKAK